MNKNQSLYSLTHLTQCTLKDFSVKNLKVFENRGPHSGHPRVTSTPPFSGQWGLQPDNKHLPQTSTLKQSLPCPCTQNLQSNLLFSYTMAEGEKMHSKPPGSLFLSRNRQPKKPITLGKLAAFNRKTDVGKKKN